MGYYTRVDGEFTITPPLTWAEIKGGPFDTGRPGTDKEAMLRTVEETVDTDEGPLVRTTAVALVPQSYEPRKYYYLVEHVQSAIDAFPGHEFTGRFDCEGEDSCDLWWVLIRDGRAVRVGPQIVWPTY